MRSKAFAIPIAALLLACVGHSHAANRAPVGGGTARAGLDGEDYANPNFEGKPAYTTGDAI